MNRLRNVRLFLSAAIALALLSITMVPALAASTTVPVGRMGVAITLEQPPLIQMGDLIELKGTIRTRLGVPISGKSITFYMNGAAIGQASSDVNGYFQRKINKNFDAGSYKITAISKESHTLLEATYTTTLKILPVSVVVQTTPSIPGVKFSLNGKIFTTDADGIARIVVGKIGQYRLTVLAERSISSNRKIEFGRWLDETYQPYRDIAVPKETFIQVGLNVYQLMGQTFVDSEGFPVDPYRVTQLSFRSLQGDSFTFPDGSPRWIPASRVSRWKSALVVVPIYYSVTSVMVDGSNVVNQSEQRFYAEPQGSWQISLILYSLKISSSDGLLGFPAGKSASIEYPDGHIKNFELDQNSSVTIHSLARGTYYITINGFSGLESRVPVALSRNQTVNSRLLTLTDMLIVGGVLLLLALILLFAGRPWLMHVLLPGRQLQGRTAIVAVFSPEVHRGNMLLTISADQSMSGTLKAPYRLERSSGLSMSGFNSLLIYLESVLPEPAVPMRLDLARQLALTLSYKYKKAHVYQLAIRYGVSDTTIRKTIKRIEAGLMTCASFKAEYDARVTESNVESPAGNPRGLQPST